MRRSLLKSRKQTTREFVARLQELNSKLDKFPPFKSNQSFKDDKLVEVLQYSLPAAWQREMRLQGFVPEEKTLSEVVKFCERMEVVETLSGDHASTMSTATSTMSKRTKKRTYDQDKASEFDKKGTEVLD